MTNARRIWLLLLLLGIGNCFIPRLNSQSECDNPPSHERLIVEKPFETKMLELTNQYRMQKGLEDFAWDESLAEIARAHSREMALQGFISHDLPSGNVSVRMVRSGYFHDGARENVARSRSIIWAHTALLESPKHEENIVADDVSRIGIGIVRAPAPYDNVLYITEIFAKPRQMPPAMAIREAVDSRMINLRHTGAGALAPDTMLEQLASNSLNALPFPYERQELRSLMAASTQKLQENGRTDLSRIDVIVQLVRDPLRLNISTPNSKNDAAAYGTAIREAMDSSNQPAFLVMTLVGFTNRPVLTAIASR